MTDQIREQVSALLDGELPRDEMALLVRRLERDPELRRTFGNYALIGDALRAPGAPLASPGFAARVSAAIDSPAAVTADSEEIEPTAPARHTPRLRRPLAVSAIAASAAVAAVLLLRPGTEPTTIAAIDSSYNANTSVQATVGQTSSSMTPGANPTPAQSQRLASYMVVHSQFSTPMVRRNVWSGLLAADPGLTRVSYESGEAN
jgi:sigma-E factor negative regulatory protein RseA